MASYAGFDSKTSRYVLGPWQVRWQGQRASDESLSISRLTASRSPSIQAQNISQTSLPMPGDHSNGLFRFSGSGWIMCLPRVSSSTCAAKILACPGTK